jgi:hypothetical protein
MQLPLISTKDYISKSVSGIKVNIVDVFNYEFPTSSPPWSSSKGTTSCMGRVIWRGMARIGVAWLGLAWLDLTWCGSAWLGLADIPMFLAVAWSGRPVLGQLDPWLLASVPFSCVISCFRLRAFVFPFLSSLVLQCFRSFLRLFIRFSDNGNTLD